MRARVGWLLAGLAAVAAGCSAPANAPVKLAPVAEVAKPSLPAWIASISPTQPAQTLAQVRVIFAKPVAKLEALAGDGPHDVLDHVTIAPALKGHFAVLTPRMVAFVPDQALPVGTRVRVTLRAGLRDLDGDTLGRDLSWTFETDALAFSDLPGSGAASDGSTPAPVGAQPKIAVTANAAVDPGSLAAHAVFTGDGDRVPVAVKLETQPTPPPGGGAAELFDPSLNDWVYDLTPQRDLHLARTYTLTIEPGVEPAYGNVATVQAFAGSVHTYDPLTIVPTPVPSPGYGDRFDNGNPAIPFNNALDPKSLAGAVSVSPAPSNVKTLTTLSDDATTIAIDPYALSPDTTYTMTVAPTVKDVYGQTLGRSQTVTMRTGDFLPGAWAPCCTSVIPAGTPVSLDFYATNLPNGTYRAAYARLSPTQLFGYADPLTFLPDSAKWPQHALAGARVNVQSVVRVPLQAQLGGAFGALAYGFRTKLDPANQPPGNVGIAQLTNLGVFAEFFPERGIVLVQHLSDGAPAGSVNVTVYRNLPNGSGTRVAPMACASGTTRADGEADFAGVDLERCYAGNGGSDAPTLGIVASQGADAATLTLAGYSGLYRFNVAPGWSNGAPLARGTVFSDRFMYQPGERGEITGIAYYVAGSQVVADRNAVYRVTLTSPSNAVTHLPDVKTDAYGVFSLPIAFSKQQALGYYTIDAKGSSGNTLSGSLRVAEFKPPNFKVTLDLSAPSATAGGSLTATTSAAYLFGAPLQGGSVHAYVTREAATVAPKGWDDYWFGRQWFWPENTPSFDTDVLQRDLPLDAQGKASLDVGVPSDLPFPMTYAVDMEATDVSNLSVADSKTFLALPADATIGLSSETVGAADKPMTIHTIVTDANGKPIAGRAIHVELQKMTYTSATQQVEGGENAQQAIEYRTVSTADATSGEKPVDVTLTPNDAGAYRVRANFAGAKSDASATDIQVFAFGAGEADWGGSDPTVVNVELDKKSYAVGDTATALIASPFDRSDVYFSVVRGDALYRTTLRDVHGATRVSFRVTEAMLPNAAVQAVVVRRGASIATLKPGALDTLARTGMSAFDVDTTARYLKLGIAPHAATVAPGGAQRVAFALTTKNGAPTQGEIVAMVVNDAILQLSGYRPPDLVATVFAAQPISALLGDSRDSVVLKTQTPPVEKGFGYGGGYLAGAAGTRVRQQFLPLAYYGVVKTDASGKAEVAFKLPDDLTTWRVMAVAIGKDDAHFAGGDATFVASLPLMLNPLLPQFARTGDTFDLGTSLSNQTGSGGALDLVMKLTGALAFGSGDPHAQSAREQAATGMQAFRFPVTVGTPAPSEVAFTATLGKFGDALRVPFTVSNAATTESVIESGVVRNGETKIPIDASAGGSLRITLANSVVPQFAGPTARLMSQGGLPLADETSSRLTIAAALARLRAPYRLTLDFDPAAESAKDVTLLLSFQRADGGFGEFAGARESDPFASAYALQALQFARVDGVAVPAGAIARARAFAAATLANPGRFKWCANDALCKARLRFEMLWSLAQSGDRRTDFLSDIVERANEFDDATRIRLARYLLQTPGWQTQGAAMADRLTQTLYLTGRYATANTTSRWSWLDSIVQAQAQMLQLLLERHAPAEQTDGAVRALVAQQCRCGWPTPDDSAAALAALSAYARGERLGPAEGAALTGGATIAGASFGSTASSQSFLLPAAAVQGGALTVRAARGTIHYTVVYTYPVPNDAPGQLAAFRVVRTVAAPASSAPPLATMDLARATAPLQVKAGDVFDVGVRVIVDHPVDRLAIEDPLPAGFEAVDTTFRTSLKAIAPQSDSWAIDAQEIYRDRVVTFAQHLGPGIYDVHYLVRSVTPGTFAWPGARAYLVDAPEEFGRSSAATLRVSP